MSRQTLAWKGRKLMNSKYCVRRPTASLLSFIFTLLFMLHVMLTPVWFGIRSILILEHDWGFFSVFPIWFVTTASLSLLFALAFSLISLTQQSRHNKEINPRREIGRR
jgi:uncharacterized BrkB/YihY/UPF0761 family membrane protein